MNDDEVRAKFENFVYFRTTTVICPYLRISLTGRFTRCCWSRILQMNVLMRIPVPDLFSARSGNRPCILPTTAVAKESVMFYRPCQNRGDPLEAADRGFI